MTNKLIVLSFKVEGKGRFCSRYISPNSTAHARVAMTTEEYYIIAMTGRCVNRTRDKKQNNSTLTVNFTVFRVYDGQRSLYRKTSNLLRPEK